MDFHGGSISLDCSLVNINCSGKQICLCSGIPDDCHASRHAIDTPAPRGKSPGHRWRKREHGAQYSDPWGLLWLPAGDQAFDGGSQRDPGLPEEDGRADQSRRHRGAHQAARRSGAPRDLFARPAGQAGRDRAADCRHQALRSGGAGDAGAAIHQPYGARADGEDRRRRPAVSFHHEHAAAAVSEADSGAGRDGSRGGLHQRLRCGNASSPGW